MTRCSSVPKRIAGKSIRRCRWRRPLWSRAGQLDSSLGVGLSGLVVAIRVCVRRSPPLSATRGERRV